MWTKTSGTALNRKAMEVDSAMRRAFTLIELLVVITIIAVLIALAIVGLMGAFRSSRGASCINNLRGCQTAIFAYTGDFKDQWPMFAQRQLARAFMNGGLNFSYTDQSGYWTIPLRGYIGERRLEPLQVCPYSPVAKEAFGPNGDYDKFLSQYASDYVVFSSYQLGWGLISDPRAWREGVGLETEYLRAVGVSETHQPSTKGMMIEPRAMHLGGEQYGATPEKSIYHPEGQDKPYNVAFIDGHVEAIRGDAMKPGIHVPGILPAQVAPVLATRDGVHGVDK